MDRPAKPRKRVQLTPATPVPVTRMDRPPPSKRTHAGSNPARNAISSRSSTGQSRSFLNCRVGVRVLPSSANASKGRTPVFGGDAELSGGAGPGLLNQGRARARENRALNSPPCGCSSMAAPVPSKHMTGVRFSVPAPILPRRRAPPLRCPVPLVARRPAFQADKHGS